MLKKAPITNKLKSFGKKHNDHGAWAAGMASELEQKYKGVKDNTYMDPVSAKLKGIKKKRKGVAFWRSVAGMTSEKPTTTRRKKKHRLRSVKVKGYSVAGYYRKKRSKKH